CLNGDGLEALFHRLAMNSLRFPETPAHYQIEAAKLTVETDLWEIWAEARQTEDGFQDWLNEPFGGQSIETAEGGLVEGSAAPTGESRRDVLAWNGEEVLRELEGHLGL